MIGTPTDRRWLSEALASFDAVLLDHAHCEKKAAATAVSLVGGYPQHDELVRRLSALAIEELRHFRAVYRLLRKRGLSLSRDTGDPYVQQLMRLVRSAGDDRLMDRLLVAALIEARSRERLELLAGALPDRKLAEFYASLARAEAGHARIFYDLAARTTGSEPTRARLAELAPAESKILAELPIAARMH